MGDKARILCVDDEPRVVDGLRLTLGRKFAVSVAHSGAEALRILQTAGLPFAAIVSDMRMPNMDGAQFLARARLTCPDSVRLLLTGHAELDAAIAAVNEGQVFRFLTKPCAPELLSAALEAAVEQFRLITCERELLEQTLRGAVNMLTDVLALSSPEIFGRAVRLREYVTAIANELSLSERWAIEISAMVSQLPLMTLPRPTLDRVISGEALSVEEGKMLERFPAVLDHLLANIPRLELIREILRDHQQPHSSNPMPVIGARVLKVALDFDVLESQSDSVELALETMHARSGLYDPPVLAALIKLNGGSARVSELKELPVSQLRPGMVLAEPLYTRSKNLLCARGVVISPHLIERLRNFVTGVGIKEPVRVIVKKMGTVDETAA